MKPRNLLLTFTVAAFALAPAACGNVGEGSGGDGGGNGDGPEISVGSKNFTEQYVLGELYAQKLSDEGFAVDKNLDLGSEQIADRALQDGQIDLYPEYTGTALVSLLDYGEEELAELQTADETYEQAAQLYSERDPANTLLERASFNNGYGVFVREEVAEEYDLQTLEDLAEVSDELTFVSFSEFQNRSDGYPNMQESYRGLDFGDITEVNSIGLAYQGVLQGEGDAGIGFQSDSQLADDELVVLEDEKEIWPFYNPAPVVRDDALEENPEIEEPLNEVTANLDLQTVQELNSRVDDDKEDPEDVATEYLDEEGLVE